MKTVFYVLMSVLFFACWGCSDSGSTDNWYEEGVARKKDRNAFIEAQKRAGISAAEASRQYDLNEAILQTEGRDRGSIDRAGKPPAPSR